MSTDKKTVMTMTSREDIVKIAESCHQVSNFLSGVTEHENRYKKKLSEADARIQDLLHDIELADFTRSEKVHFGNKLKEARIERRVAKDIIELLDPLGKTVKDISSLAWKLNEIYNKVNEIIKIQDKRVYTPRISSDLKMPLNSHVEAEKVIRR